MNLKIGDKAPFFEGINEQGELISLNNFSGKKLILYFYPKNNTPGCTAEACNLNDNYEFWLNQGYHIVGVSPDKEESHKKFKEKYSLQFNLIADTEKKILKSYEAWGEKKNFGRIYDGVLRSTFIINEKGIIEEIQSYSKESYTL